MGKTHNLLVYIKYWFKLERISCILLVLFIASLVTSFIGLPKQVNETLEACILTEASEQIPCTVALEGKVTYYPFRPGKHAMTDQLRVTVDGNFLANACYDTGNTYYVHSDSRTVELILWIGRDTLLAEFDIQQLFPQRESCRAVLAAPVQSPEQIGSLLNDPNLAAIHRESFSWILE